MRSAGAYVCGEETAMISVLEGNRPDPRRKPPYPTESGLFGRSTCCLLYTSIDAASGDGFGATYRNYYPVDNGLGMNPQKLASLDGADYALTQTVDTSSGATTGYYSLDVTNPESTNLEEVRISDMLPLVGDQMTLTSNAKKSTVQLQVDGMTLADGSALPSSCELYYSEDATPATNLVELTDFTVPSGATWIPWDGASTLPASAKAVKLVKTDGLNACLLYTSR